MAVMLITGIQAADKSSVAQAADSYASAGFTLVLQDIVLGRYLTELTAAVRTRPLNVVMLASRPEVVRQREDARRLARGKIAYKPGGEGPAQLDAYLRRGQASSSSCRTTSGRGAAASISIVAVARSRGSTSPR